MKVLDHIVFLGEIRGLSAAVAKREPRMAARLECGLGSKKVEELSKGMQQRSSSSAA